MSDIISINSQKPPCAPTRMTIGKSDLYSDSSKRSAESGTLLLYPIRKNIYSLELEYLCTKQQCKEIENMMNATEFTVKFMDNDEEKIAIMYVSDRVKEVTGTAENRQYLLNFSLIEV